MIPGSPRIDEQRFHSLDALRAGALLLGARNSCRSARLIVPVVALPSASNTSVAVTIPTS